MHLHAVIVLTLQSVCLGLMIMVFGRIRGIIIDQFVFLQKYLCGFVCHHLCGCKSSMLFAFTKYGCVLFCVKVCCSPCAMFRGEVGALIE